MSGIANWQAQIRIDIEDLKKRIKVAEGEINNFTNEDRKVKLDIDTKTLESAIQKLDKMLDSLGKGTDDFKQFEHLSKELSSVVSEVQSLSKAFGKVDDSGTKTLLSSIQNIDKSLSELSHNILNVNKNMSNMGGKQIENISNAYGDATKNAEKLAEIQNKLSNKSNSSSNNVVGTMLPSDSEFKTVLSNLDTTKSKLGEIVKITEKINSDGKKSYVLRDKNGSTETYNINSKTQKGQIENSSYVQYDANAITKAKKEELAIEQEITKEHEKQVSTRQKKWQSFQREQQQYLSNQNENEAVNRNKKVYQELTDTIQRYSDVSKRVAGNNAFDGDLEEIQNLEDKISKLQKEPILSKLQVEKSERDLIKLYDRLDDLERKIQQTNNNKIVSNADKSTKSEWDKNVKAIQDYIDAVTKLNNLRASDKGTGKKSYEIAGQIEEIEKLKKEAYNARQVLSSMVNPHSGDIDTWNKWLEVMNKFDQASLGSAESVNRLKDSLKNVLNSEMNSLQGSIDKYQKIITQAQTYPSDFHPSTKYNTTLAKLESENEILKNYKASLQGVTELTKDQQATINKLTQNCEKAATEFKKLSAAEKGTTEVGIEKAIQRINKDLAENTKYSAEAKAGLNTLLVQLKSGDPSINLRKITEEIIRIENAEIAAGRAGKSLWDIFKTKSTYGFIGQMQSFLSMYVGFYGMINAAKKVGSTLVELDTALVDLKKTTTMSSSELENFYYDSNDIAKQMGVTTQAIIDQASAWSRLGYSTKEQSETMAKLSSQFASISPGMSTDEAQEGLVSIMKAFDIDPNDVETEIMDKVNVLGNKFAENNQDVVEGLKRSAAAMSAMGQSFTDTAALFTGGMEILQDSESMGTALRTLSMRIRGYDEETNQLSDDLVNVTGEVADLTKTTKNAQGISLFTDASQEHYKSMVQYLGEIADEWDQISEKNQTELLQKLFGKNRANESVCPYVQKCA
jgi:TP901 family phage tail tape measure protein